MKIYRRGTILLTAAALAASAAFASAAESATTAGAEEAADLTEVTVTARRRDENIVDVPLAISVIGEKEMQKLGITSTTQLAQFVPGLEFNDFTQGNSRNDRGPNRPLIFRGLNLGLGGTITAAGGMFLDGAAVVGNEVAGGLDIGAVEILRGPQSVYFGRSTMTGAVSYRTKAIPNVWGITANIKAAQRRDRSVEVSVAGPVIEGIMGLRLTALNESTDGYTRNDYNGGTLGDRSRKAISASMQFTGGDTFDMKLYGSRFDDDDGASATVFLTTPISLTGANSCRQPVDAANLVAGVPLPVAPVAGLPAGVIVRNTICGEIPTPSRAGPGIAINYHNTNIPQQFIDTIFATPLIAGEGFDPQVGLQRKVVNTHLVANYKISDYMKLQLISGYHSNVTINAADGIGESVGTFFQNNQYFYTFTGRTRDTSHELRLSSDPNRKFSWTAGTNYIDGFNRVNAIVAFLQQRGGGSVANPAGLPLAALNYLPIPQGVGTSYAVTSGYFAGGYLKVLDDKLTLSGEGRYQTDKRKDISQTTLGVTTAGPFEKKFTSFSPRVSVDYDLGDKHKVYASYARGNRPGGFNAGLASRLDPASPLYNATAAAEIRTLIGISDLSFKEEELSTVEVGFKGYLAEGKGYFDINAYSGKVSNQQVNNATLIPSLGFTVAATTNIGETKIHGVEFQGNYNFTRELSLQGTLAWNYAERTKFRNTGGFVQFGKHILDGVKMALAPERTASAVLSYERPVSDTWNFFTNGALVYRGKMFMDVGNLSWIPARTQIDLRVGASHDNYRIEAFVMNVLNDQSYTGGNVATDFGGSGDAGGYYSTRGYAFFGALAPPRQLGVRLNVNF